MEINGQLPLRHRQATTFIRPLQADQCFFPEGTTLKIEQKQHDFLFGSNMFNWERLDTPEQNKVYADHFASLFSYGVCEFYWGKPPKYARMDGYEPNEGDIRSERRRQQVKWCHALGLKAKGHPLLFFREPEWVGQKEVREWNDLSLARIPREVEAFRGQMDIWDVVNEPIMMSDRAMKQNAIAQSHLFATLGELGVVKKAFHLARPADPNAMLMINDYVTDDRYIDLVAQALDAGVPIQAVGIQHHECNEFGGYERAFDICERFSRLGLPLHITEIMLPSGNREARKNFNWVDGGSRWVTVPEGEERQAQEAVELYRALFGHPVVTAITWWDFCDQGAFMDLPVGLLREDGSPKPAYHALRDLIRKQWWTNAEVKVDAQGLAQFTGFLGEYQVSCGEGASQFRGKFQLKKNAPPTQDVQLTPVSG